MAHSSELRWVDASSFIENASRTTLDALNGAEEIYQELNEVYNFVGGTDQLLADQLFAEEIQLRGVSPFEANTEEVAKAADLRAAIVALHQLYQALNNIAVTQTDRAVLLRRMS